MRGVTSDVYARLAPYVCALPSGTQHQRQHGERAGAAGTRRDITQAQAESLWQNGQAHWSGRDEFVQQSQQQNITVDHERL